MAPAVTQVRSATTGGRRTEDTPHRRTALCSPSRPPRKCESERTHLWPIRPRTAPIRPRPRRRSEEHTSELQSLMRISYAVFCLKKKKSTQTQHTILHSRINNNTTQTEYTQRPTCISKTKTKKTKSQ